MKKKQFNLTIFLYLAWTALMLHFAYAAYLHPHNQASAPSLLILALVALSFSAAGTLVIFVSSWISRKIGLTAALISAYHYPFETIEPQSRKLKRPAVACIAFILWMLVSVILADLIAVGLGYDTPIVGGLAAFLVFVPLFRMKQKAGKR